MNSASATAARIVNPVFAIVRTEVASGRTLQEGQYEATPGGFTKEEAQSEAEATVKRYTKREASLSLTFNRPALYTWSVVEFTREYDAWSAPLHWL